MSDGTGLVVALLELHGFRVLEVTEMSVVITIETVATVVGCEGCGTRAGSGGVAVRDPLLRQEASAAEFVASGAIGPNGSLPTSAHSVPLSQSYTVGAGHVAGAIRQLGRTGGTLRRGRRRHRTSGRWTTPSSSRRTPERMPARCSRHERCDARFFAAASKADVFTFTTVRAPTSPLRRSKAECVTGSADGRSSSRRATTVPSRRHAGLVQVHQRSDGADGGSSHQTDDPERRHASPSR